MSQSPHESYPGQFYLEKELEAEGPFFRTTEESDEFVRWLDVKLQPFVEQFGPEEWYKRTSKEAKPWQPHYQYDIDVKGKGQEARYIFETYESETFSPGSYEWEKFTSTVNEDEDIAQEIADDDLEYYIDPNSSPADHEVTIFATREYVFRLGRPPRVTGQWGYIVDKDYLTISYTIGANADDKFLNFVEQDLATTLSKQDIFGVLEALEAFDLYKIPRSSGKNSTKNMPNFADENQLY